MSKVLLRIDSDGFLLFGEDLIVEEVDNIGDFLDYVTTPLPTDDKGNQLAFYKPKWTGAEWIEGATQEEIDEITKVDPLPPTDAERIDMLENMILLMMEG